jgi:membrane dipeptidase
MKRYFLLLLLSACFSTLSLAQSYKKIHFKAILTDSHNDIISTCIQKGYTFDEDLTGKTYSDLNRMLRAGVDVQVFSIWCDGHQKDPFTYANREIDTLYAWIGRNPRKMMLVTDPKELYIAVRKHKLGCMIGVEGGHMMENNLDKLDSLFKRGVRYMTLTWNNSTPWATSAFEETNDSLLHQAKGLSEFGKEVVKHMNVLGMMVDLSHVGEQTFWDAIHTSTKPLLISHSCVYKLCPVYRNLKDDQIKAVARNGGVIDLNFFSGFIDSNFESRNKAFFKEHGEEFDSIIHSGRSDFFSGDYLYAKYKNEVNDFRPPLSMLMDHLDYIVKLVGVDYVGLGSDFDGIDSSPLGLDDVMGFINITKALLQRGYSKKDIYKILGGNFIRVFKANMN